MNDENTSTRSVLAIKVEGFYYDCQNWKSKLYFMEDETIFIDRLLNSYVFEPDTPNLFEQLQDYRDRLQKLETKKREVIQRISEHENNLGGMLKFKTDANETTCYQQHDAVQAQVVDCAEDFQNLRLEIFKYAGGILKKRKHKE